MTFTVSTVVVLLILTLLARHFGHRSHPWLMLFLGVAIGGTAIGGVLLTGASAGITAGGTAIGAFVHAVGAAL